ncbi:wsv280 [White spot syndrome virus]|uniref:Wsv280 n=4 Tax=White spot syndrome virus TaxID=342409 RepID=Q8VAU9_WSSVS|nr:wsv280 [Shrimp white spot syndrome virus]AFX59654.1 wsv280 [White spot syndrome virus]AAL33283.1 wsv280 [Shrimp white spot syndrome virus]AAL89203.1 WSSV335 [Shrimp white spot syndrome virus]AWQ61274.1 wsv280 [Shrimp white spot syndrome virus]AWQ61713.1 wsv280 [Shrimp white spot syndrome virus]
MGHIHLLPQHRQPRQLVLFTSLCSSRVLELIFKSSSMLRRQKVWSLFHRAKLCTVQSGAPMIAGQHAASNFIPLQTRR